MSANFLVVLGLLFLSALCIVVSVIAMRSSKYDSKGNVTEWDSPFGKVKSNSLPFLILIVGLVFSYFAYSLQTPSKQELIQISGEVFLEDKYAKDVHSIVVGVTEPRWVNSITPVGDGKSLTLKIDVPKNWASHTAYAFVHGDAPVRPIVMGVDRDNPSFKMRLSGHESD